MNTNRKKTVVYSAATVLVTAIAALIFFGNMRPSEETLPAAAHETVQADDIIPEDSVSYSDTYIYASYYDPEGEYDEDGKPIRPKENKIPKPLTARDIKAGHWVAANHFTDAARLKELTDTDGEAFTFSILADAPFEEFRDESRKIAYLYAEGFSNWIKIDSATADAKGSFSFSGKAPGTGMYMIATQNMPYSISLTHGSPCFIFPLDSNTVRINRNGAYSKHPDINKWEPFRTLLFENATMIPLILNDKKIIPTDSVGLEAFKAGLEVIKTANEDEEKKALYAMAPSPEVILAVKYSNLEINHPRHKFFFKKKLIPKLQQAGISESRIAALEAMVNEPYKATQSK
ncbi:MAG: DUF4369 domain-containing protein [Bacteroidota bacterium]